MQTSGWTPAYRSTSATLTAHGSAAPMRTPMGCCASTFPKAPTSACTAPRRLQPWRPPSTPAPERRLGGKHLPRRLISCFGQPTNIMLRRPLESAHPGYGECLRKRFDRGCVAVAGKGEAVLGAIGADYLAHDHLEMALLLPVAATHVATIEPDHHRAS